MSLPAILSLGLQGQQQLSLEPGLTRAEVWRKPRGAEGDGAAALGGRAGGREKAALAAS